MFEFVVVVVVVGFQPSRNPDGGGSVSEHARSSGQGWETLRPHPPLAPLGASVFYVLASL